MNKAIPSVPILRQGAERYERLRQHALGGPQPEAELLSGLDVLLQAGLAAWMCCPTLACESGDGKMVPALYGCQPEATLVLAEMTLPQLVSPRSAERTP